MELREVVRRRRMVRRYLPDPVDPAVVERILAQALRAPSAGFAQGQRFLVVTDPAARARIAAACDEEEHVGRGLPRWISVPPVLVIPCVARQAYLERYAEPDKSRSVGPDGWDVPFEWIDLGAAFMLLLLGTVDEGLAAGFLAAAEVRLRDAVTIPEAWTPIGVVTIGHPAPDDPPGSGRRRARIPEEDAIQRR